MTLKKSIFSRVSQAIEVPYAMSKNSAEKLRRAHPNATPAQCAEIAAKKLVNRAGATSAGVGAVAAYPGAGTALSVVSSGAQLVSFVGETALFTLTLADLYGIDVKDPSKRTALVLAVLTGKDGAEAITGQLGIQTVSWFRNAFVSIQTASAQQFNTILTKWLRRRAVRKATASTAGRLLPFGAGAAVGWTIGRSMAKGVVEAAQVALGPAPLSFDEDPLVVDVEDVTPAKHDVPFEEITLKGV